MIFNIKFIFLKKLIQSHLSAADCIRKVLRKQNPFLERRRACIAFCCETWVGLRRSMTIDYCDTRRLVTIVVNMYSYDACKNNFAKDLPYAPRPKFRLPYDLCTCFIRHSTRRLCSWHQCVTSGSNSSGYQVSHAIFQCERL